MKFTVTLKDPDGPYECIRDAAKDSLESITGLSKDEAISLLDARTETLSAFANKWLKYGEYAVIEFDTETDTATLIRKK